MTITTNKSTNGIAVLLIYTGGTIGMVENPNSGKLEVYDFDYIEQHVPEIKSLAFGIDTIAFDPPRDSSDTGEELWVQIAEVIMEHFDDYDGFVVLHGTDTMAYTASGLSFIFENLTKPILLTGSQVPIGKLRTDGRENLLTALEIAACQEPNGRACVHEVCVLFNNQLIRGNRCTKSSSDQFFAFESPNYPTLASVGIELDFHKQNMLPYPDQKSQLETHTQLDNNILVMRLFPGLKQEVLEACFRAPGLRGIVLETFGSGNAPTNQRFLDLIQWAVDRGIVIVNVTQCLRGKVQMSRYETGRTLLKAGVISGYDMTVEAAVAKLMYLLGRFEDPEEIKKWMGTNLRGELTI